MQTAITLETKQAQKIKTNSLIDTTQQFLTVPQFSSATKENLLPENLHYNSNKVALLLKFFSNFRILRRDLMKRKKQKSLTLRVSNHSVY